MIEIDGSQGEGGGQVLRTALALSLVTQQPFCLHNIRAKRPKPGLMRQHLACVNAARRIAPGSRAAQASGAQVGLGSQTLVFQPQAVVPGAYDFAIGSAGSTMLVLQTVLWPLTLAGAPSELRLSGGTHGAMAPTSHFMQALSALLGQGCSIELRQAGFYPTGGGEVMVRIEPRSWAMPCELGQRGALLRVEATALHAGLPAHVAERWLEVVQQRLGWATDVLHNRSQRAGTGSGGALILHAQFEHCFEQATVYAKRGVNAEGLAQDACEAMQAYLRHDAPVGEHLADQLMLPAALSECPVRYRCTLATGHVRTNAQTINAFLPDAIGLEATASSGCLVLGNRHFKRA